MFEWDENKRRSNAQKHGVDFVLIEGFEWATALIAADTRHDEPRFVAIGYIGNRLYVAVYARRGENTRVISLRKANRREVKRYAET